MAKRRSSAARDLVGDGVPVVAGLQGDDDDALLDEAETMVRTVRSGASRCGVEVRPERIGRRRDASETVTSICCAKEKEEGINMCARARGSEETTKWRRGLTGSSAACPKQWRCPFTPARYLGGVGVGERGKMGGKWRGARCGGREGVVMARGGVNAA